MANGVLMPWDPQESSSEPGKQSGPSSSDGAKDKAAGSKPDALRLLEEFLNDRPASHFSAEYLAKNFELHQLVEKRNALENKLPPEKKKLLQEYRLALSCTDLLDERLKYRELIDNLDPSLAKINYELNKTHPLPPPRLLPPARLADRTPMLSTISARKDEHQLEPLIELLAKKESKYANQLPEYQENWYAPYKALYRENKDLAHQYSLEVELRDEGGHVIPKFYVPLAGKKEYLSANDQKALENEVNERIEAKLRAIEQNLNNKVHFTRVGEEVVKVFYRDESGKYIEGKHILRGQQWSLNNLCGVEEALNLSQVGLNGPRINFAHLFEQTYVGHKLHAGEYWWATKTDGPKIILFRQDRTVELSDQQLNWERMGIRNCTNHEIVHHEQAENDFWNQTDLIQRMGWHQYRKGTGKEAWLLKGKDNKYFMYLEDIDKWMLCNKNGQAIDEQFKLVADGAKMQLYSSAQVRERMLVKAATGYFDDPSQTHAEIVALIRSGSAGWMQLLSNDPNDLTLFDIAKEWDQKMIDRHQKETDPQSLPGKTIRLPDGSLVETTAGLALVDAFKTLFTKKTLFDGDGDEVFKSLRALEGIDRRMWFDAVFSQLQPEVRRDYDDSLKRIASIEPDARVLQMQLDLLQKMKDHAEMDDFIQKKSLLLKRYADCRAQTYAQCAAFELAQGSKEKAGEYLRLARQGGEVNELILDGDKLGDDQLAMFTDFKSIKKLSINRTNITDAAFNTINKFTNLEQLIIGDAKQITDTGLSKLSGMNSLKILSLGDLPKISDAGLAQLKNMQSIDELQLVNVPVTINGVQQVMQNLKTLKLEKINIGDSGVNVLSAAPSLGHLQLFDTNITDSALLQVKNFPVLRRLDIRDSIGDQGLRNLHGAEIGDLFIISSKIKGDGLIALKELPYLNVLNLRETQISAAFWKT